ncbi:hypothetical protein N9917_01400 [Deltaproteobacteria bacterium]|nr:hypothetical protein [Deltaproteobacteria bacterium]
MGVGYQVEINRRYGGHGGHDTEWEFSTRADTGRVKKLQALNHTLLVAFHFYQEGGGSDGFCVLRGDPSNQWMLDERERLVILLMTYLTMWPDPEKEAEVLTKIHRICHKHYKAVRTEALAGLNHYHETGEELPDPIHQSTKLISDGG